MAFNIVYSVCTEAMHNASIRGWQITAVLAIVSQHHEQAGHGAIDVFPCNRSGGDCRPPSGSLECLRQFSQYLLDCVHC